MTGTYRILLVHPDTSLRERTAVALARPGLHCISAADWPAVEKHLIPGGVVAVVLRVGGDRPGEAVVRARELLPEGKVIAVVPHGNTTLTRAVFRAGAWDCLEEPVDEQDLSRSIAEAVGWACGPRPASNGEPLINRDGLTPFCGHSAFLDTLAGLRSLCRRQGVPLSLMMLDLDRFRECNERHSPAFGDRVLRWFASLLQHVRRRSDLVTRYHSDRFLVALPQARADEARQLAERCRRRMQEAPLRIDGREHEVTVSVAVVESTHGFIETEQQLIRRVGLVLEHIKQLGGNRIMTWTELVDAQPSREDVQRFNPQNINHWMRRVRQQLRCTYLESTRALVAAVEAKDPYTRAHSLTVSGHAEAIGRRMRLPTSLIESVRVAALLHDVGKIGVPDAILTKPGPLTAEEFEVIKRHPGTALDILGHVSFLAEERPMILHHHERFDGKGYPTGLAGNRIPVGARVLAMADALDAMLSSRSYKPAFEVERVRAEVVAGAGRQFDPAVAEVTLDWLGEASADFPPATGSVTT